MIRHIGVERKWLVAQWRVQRGNLTSSPLHLKQSELLRCGKVTHPLLSARILSC